MSNLPTPLPTDVWEAAACDDYQQTMARPALAKAKGYCHKGHMRLELSPVGHDQAAANSLIDFAVRLFCTVQGVAFKGWVNCRYRRAGVQECQPDLSYYWRDNAQAIPWGTAAVDLNRYPAPDLAIEIAVSSLLDDQGTKRSLYEDLSVTEYWGVDVPAAQILAYTMADRGSQRIDASLVLAGLDMAVLESAMPQSRQQDQAQVGAWLLAQFQN